MSTSKLTVPITGQAETPEGLKVAVSGNVTVNLTITQPTPTPTPTPNPIPGPGISIDRVTDAGGANITQAVGGSVVYIRGSGMGSAGKVTVAGQLVVVQEWLPYMLTVRLPVVRASVSGPVTIFPTGLVVASSAFGFTITG